MSRLAVSATPEGPFKFADVAINTWAHNAAPIALPGGAYAIVHIGTGTGGPDGGRNCSNGTSTAQSPSDPAAVDAFAPMTRPSSDPTPRPQSPKSAGKLQNSVGSRIHIASTLAGPWLPLLNDTLPTADCDNPGPWVHPNGTLFVACGRQIKGDVIHLWRAERIWGPWTLVSEMHPAGMVPSGPPGKWEDEFVYTDRRGHFHALWHAFYLEEPERKSCVNSTVSAHTFSLDGITWFASATQPYTTQIVVTGGAGAQSTITVSTRERPKLYFNSSGWPTHLLNGVSGASQCYLGGPPSACANCKLRYWDYTVVVPLAV